MVMVDGVGITMTGSSAEVLSQCINGVYAA